MNILKKTLKIAFAVILAMIFVASIVVIIASVSQRDKGFSGAFGYTFDVVATDSMEPTFMVNDMIIGKVIGADTVIENGDIITFKTMEQGVVITKTHRVVDQWDEGNIGRVYKTKGDHEDKADLQLVKRESVVAVCSEDRKIDGIGKVLNLLKEPIGFLILAIPIGLYILYEIFVLISIFMANKKEQMLEETNDAKDAIIREYLAKQAAEQAQKEAAEPQNPVDEATPADGAAESDKKD